MHHGNPRRRSARGPQVEGLEERKLLSHASPALAAEVRALEAQPAAQVAHGGNDTVTNTYDIYNVYTNYWGGTIGVQAFTDGLFYEVFHSAPNAKISKYFAAELEDGTLYPYQVASTFFAKAKVKVPSDTGHGNLYTNWLGGPDGVTAFVDGLYHDVLHRAPDAKGAAFWEAEIEGPAALRPGIVTDAFLQAAGQS